MYKIHFSRVVRRWLDRVILNIRYWQLKTFILRHIIALSMHRSLYILPFFAVLSFVNWPQLDRVLLIIRYWQLKTFIDSRQ